MRHRDGRRSVIDIDGWIVGEDGIRGMRGRVIDKFGQLILASLGVGAVAGTADIIAPRRGNRIINQRGENALNVDGDDFDYIGSSALGRASDRLTLLLQRRYESLIPVVEVLSGREVVAVFSKPAEVAVIDGELY